MNVMSNQNSYFKKTSSLEINEDMFSRIIEEFFSYIDENMLIYEEENEENLVLQNEEVTIHKVVAQVECDVKSKLLLLEESYNKEATHQHKDKEGSICVLSRGCTIKHLIHMEAKKSSQVMLAAEKEVTIEDEATHAAAPEGEIFQLTYAL